jgi:hypothetical protein
MNTSIRSSRKQKKAIEQTQFVMKNRKDINLRFAQKIIEWYFSRYALNWRTFLEAKRIAQITNNTSFVSKVFQFRTNYALNEAENRCS